MERNHVRGKSAGDSQENNCMSAANSDFLVIAHIFSRWLLKFGIYMYLYIFDKAG